MKARFARVLGVLTALAALLLSVSGAYAAGGGNPFRNLTTTAGGYPTWDSDMINIEDVTETGAGVYVAILDTGLAPNWRDYFPEERVDTKLGTGFYQPVTFRPRPDNPCGVEVEVGRLHQTTWVGSTSATHGTHVASTIIGYFYRANADLFSGFALPPIVVRGIASDVTIIPVKVLADYQVPALPDCEGGLPAEVVNFGTDPMVAAGIDYVTELKMGPLAGSPVVINMSLGGPEPAEVLEDAIDRAIDAGVIVVAAAGNSGTDGMDWPGAYPQVISAGASGWTEEWLFPGGDEFFRLWWLQSNLLDYNDIPEPTPTAEVYVADFSSRELPGEPEQELDVLAPVTWVRGPYPGYPGYAHLPWWSGGIGDIVGWNPGNFYYVGGTSMATPHVAAVAALMLEKDPSLIQADVEAILKTTALPIPPGSATVYDLVPTPGWYTYDWGVDATGYGLLQADAALAVIP